jgi:hypothetical protein
MSADRFKDAIISLISELLPERKFLAHVEYSVTKSAGGKIEAIPKDDSSGYPALAGVAVRGFFAANKSELPVGASVMIAWERGRREAPFIANVLELPKSCEIEAEESASIKAPEVNLGEAPTLGVARMGDLAAGIFAITTASATVKAGP